MRKKSNYRPKGVRLDNLSWVTAGFKKVGSLPTAGVALKLKNHEALDAVLMGGATRDHVDVLIGALNMAESFYHTNPELGEDWASEINAAQEALYQMAQRGARLNSFVFTAPEMVAVKLAMSVHDVQLDNATVREMELSLEYVESRVKSRHARAICAA